MCVFLDKYLVVKRAESEGRGKEWLTFPSFLCIDLKEVLRRENQGLKVYTVDRSSVFSMTGTYF